MPLSSISSFDPSRFFGGVQGSQSGSRLETGVSAFAVSNDLNGQLSVTTAEGDRVTFSADLAFAVQGGSYHQVAKTAAGTASVSAQSLSVSFEQEFGVTVQGDLNEQEQQDLSSLFHTVTKLFRKFFRGQDEAATETAAHLAQQFSGLSSLSSLDLNVEVQRSVAVVAARSRVGFDDGTGSAAATADEAPATAAAIPQPSTGTEASRPSTVDASHLVAASGDQKPASSLIQDVMDAIERSRVETETLRKVLPDFFAALRDRLKQEAQDRHQAEVKPLERHDTPLSEHPLRALAAYQPATFNVPALSAHS